MKNILGISLKLLLLLTVINATIPIVSATAFAQDKNYKIWTWSLDEKVLTPPHKSIFYVSVEKGQALGAGKGVGMYMYRRFNNKDNNYKTLDEAKAWINSNYDTKLQEWLDDESEKRYGKRGIWRLAPITTIIYRR